MQSAAMITPSNSTYDASTRTVTWSTSDLSVNDMADFHVSVTIDSSLVSGAVLNVVWTITATGMPNVTKNHAIRLN